MNVGEIKRRVSSALGDNAKLVFTDAALLDMINDAQMDLARKTACLGGVLFEDVNAGTESFDLPPLCIETKRVTYQGTKLNRTTWQELDMMDPGRDNTTGVPTHYFIDGTDVHLYPIPSAFAAAALAIYYVAAPVPLTADTDILQIPIAFHEDIVVRCIARGHEQVEDYQASQMKSAEYTQSVTLTQQQLLDSSEESYPYIRDTEWQVY